jgi:MFS family permease
MTDTSHAADTSAPAQELPAQAEVKALATPTQPKGLGFQLFYGLANATIGIGNITFYTLLLPGRLAQLAPRQQTSTFILISLLGALASVVTNPLVGAFSDHTTSPLGRRLPWLLVGVVLLIVAMLTLAYASTVPEVGGGAVLLQIAINALLAALSAIIPDQVPLGQRATVSAWAGMAPLVGGLLGQILVAQVIKNLATSFLVLALVSVCLLLVFCLVLSDQRLLRQAAAPFRPADVPKSLWLNPKAYPDFARVWGARCLVFLAATTQVNYLYYFLQDGVRYAHTTGQPVAQGVQQLYLVYVCSLFLASLVCGKLSDRLQLRKPFVIGSSGLMAVGMLLLPLFPVWSMVLVGIVIVGSGFGGYLSSDLALASQLLPEAKNRGKDFGLMNAAIFLPMLVAPAIIWVSVNQFQSYPALFAVLALGTLLAAILVAPLRSVR